MRSFFKEGRYFHIRREKGIKSKYSFIIIVGIKTKKDPKIKGFKTK